MPRPFSQPLWNRREPTQGKTILLHAEQGFGDAIQFLRYVPMLASLGANVLLELPAELETLAQRLPGVYRLVERGQALPAFDMHCPLLSLPFAFQTTLESIPANVPYLSSDPALVESWRRKPALAAPGLKVALAWAGSPMFRDDRTRSLTLDQLAPLADLTGVHFYSIQKGSSERQADHPPPDLRLINLSPELHNFADTAAVMSLMDLVITTDTAVAHLAGALARPAWVMLQFVPDWRWLLHRHDSPWYPTMRLFRQSTLGDWPGVIAQIAQALKAFRPSEPVM